MTSYFRIGLLALALAASTLIADDARKTFDSLFGQSVRKVKSTREFDDDLALAKSMVDGAKSERDSPALVSLICDEAFALAVKSPEGRDAAKAAMALKSERDPSTAAANHQRVVDAYQRWIARARGGEQTTLAMEALELFADDIDRLAAAGDYPEAIKLARKAMAVASRGRLPQREAISTRIKELTRRQTVERRIEAIKKRLKDDPDDTSDAAELMGLLVVQIDDPAEAGKFSFLYDKEDAAKIALAAKDTAKLGLDDLYTLGVWYAELAASARGVPQLLMYRRAQLYYRTFLDKVGGEKNLRATSVQLAMPPIQEARLELEIAHAGALAGEKFDGNTINSLGMDMAMIKPGQFVRGTPAHEAIRYVGEDLHPVELTRPFLIARHEVTIGQFRKFVTSSRYKTEAEIAGKAENWRSPPWEATDEHPVVHVTIKDVVEFCAWLSKREQRTYRLPTEAEWEYCCRAGTTTVRYGPIDAIAWHTGNAGGSPHPVGKKQPNAWGLYDMLGNVWEWTGHYAETYPKDGKKLTDPQGPGKGSRVVARGGSFVFTDRHARAAHRGFLSPTTHDAQRGFRVVLEIE